MYIIYYKYYILGCAFVPFDCQLFAYLFNSVLTHMYYKILTPDYINFKLHTTHFQHNNTSPHSPFNILCVVMLKGCCSVI